MKELEGRMRKVEQAIRGVEDDAWRRSNPEARARAADTVAQLEASIADLRGQARQGRGRRQRPEGRRARRRHRGPASPGSTEARKALDEFSA